MAKESGINVLLKVGDGAGTEVFTTLLGQKQTKLGGSSTAADTTDKSNNGWKTSLVTEIDGQVTCSGAVSVGDAMLNRLEAQWRALATVNCQLIKNSAGDKYQGAFYVTSFDITGDVKAETQYSITLSPAASLTYTGS